MQLVKSQIAKLVGKYPLCNLNPDEVVAKGAAVYASMRMKNESLKDTVLTDVCPYTLGIGVVDETFRDVSNMKFDPIIERNMTVPISRVKYYYPVSPTQKQIKIKVFQGENRNPDNNIFLGMLIVDINPGPLTEPKVAVRFTYNTNGILEVILKSLDTNQEKRAVLLNNSTLSDEEAAQCMKQLESIKIHPRDTEENLYRIAKAEKIYELTLGDIRSLVDNELSIFINALNTQEPLVIESAQKRIDNLFEHLEEYL